jgi:hypothetical protein
MIYLYNANYTRYYPTVPAEDNNFVYPFPENTATEAELIAYLDRILTLQLHYPEDNLYIKTNSLIVFTYFRVAIKEHMLDHTDFEARFYNGGDDPILIHIDADGRLPVAPPIGFLDTYRDFLRRLM